MFYKYWGISLFLCSVWNSALGVSREPARVKTIQVEKSSGETRIVLELSKKVSYKLFPLEAPPRIVLDLKDSQLQIPVPRVGEGIILRMRHASHPGSLRIVFDLKTKATPKSVLFRSPDRKGYRLVIELPSSFLAQSEMSASVKPKIIAIDAGHGGQDRGAMGKCRGLREKDVTLRVAKKLCARINQEKGMRAFLVRKGDYYLGLRKRMALASEGGAELFVSIHADSCKDKKARGASVFVLSEKGATSEAARWLAARENQSCVGDAWKERSDLLAPVLFDLSQTASRTASHALARCLLQALSQVTPLHCQAVQSAGFVVLKLPALPSVLVELEFLSNPSGEKQLAESAYQDKLAKALLLGIRSYLAERTLLRPTSLSE